MKNRIKLIIVFTFLSMLFATIGLLCACDLNHSPNETKNTTPYNLKFILRNGSYTVSKGETTDTEIEIPVSYEGKKVTCIQDSGFSNYSLLEKITIPNTIQVIGSSAFQNCTNLKTVTIKSRTQQDSLSVGDYSFAGCNSLVNVELPNHLKTVGKFAFQNCSSLKDVKIPNSVEAIGKSTFSGCSSLERIELPFIGSKSAATEASPSTLFGYIFGTDKFEEGKETTQYYAQNESTVYYIPMLLTDLTIANANLLYGAFYNCSQIKSLTLKNVSNIDQKCFFGADYIETANIPAEVIAYLPKDKLTHITISGGQNISAKALSECDTLKEVNIAGYLSEIGEGAFSVCWNLEKVTMSNYIKKIGNGAFGACPNLKTVNLSNSLVEIGDEAFSCTGLKNLEIPAKVEKVGNYAFSNCLSLVSVTIGSGVQSIGYQAFYNCNSLSNVIFSETSRWIVYQSVGNEIAVNGLEDATTAANLLCNRYTDYYWKRG